MGGGISTQEALSPRDLGSPEFEELLVRKDIFKIVSNGGAVALLEAMKAIDSLDSSAE